MLDTLFALSDEWSATPYGSVAQMNIGGNKTLGRYWSYHLKHENSSSGQSGFSKILRKHRLNFFDALVNFLHLAFVQ